ncbi:MAG: diadenylate cyclase CdaA [Candidatus Omnitrophica bacterium]|nr:diadenylate cyclase CdaA [Candidatus Omnitrophota bacterium]
MNLADYFLIWKPLLEISILWLVIYHIILFFEGTRALAAMRGIIIVLVAFFVFQKLNLTILDWLLTKLFGISVIAILIVFHPEIRQGLSRLGQGHLFAQPLRKEDIEQILQQIVKAAEDLCRNKEGALIAIEKNDSLNTYIANGVPIDGRVSSELIENIFIRNSLLHDGGLVIQHGRIAAAGCLFPLSESQGLSRVFGTRHRAALGLSQETDAIIIVVSEERQDISLVYRSRLYKDLSGEEILFRIKDILQIKT